MTTKKILLIEDDTVMRENAAEILDLAHYAVTTAKDGKEGVEIANKLKPDLIVCDIMMPKLDGYGVLHILAKDPQTAAIPFIFLTAKAEKSEMRKGMELGADDYLTKPFEETELLNAIEVRLKKSEAMKKEFAQNLEGLNQFLDQAGQARGLKDLEILSQKRPLVHYKKNEIIFHEGDKPQHLYFLSKGKVKTYKSHEDGKEYVTALFKPGEFFGFIPLLKNADYSDSAMTLEDSEICKIPKEDFLALIYKNRDVAGQFMKMLAGHAMEKEQQLLSLAYDTVRKKVAAALLLLESRYRESDPGNKKTDFRITIHRDNLASIAGTATETVIRSLSEFKDDKLIKIDGRVIIILNSEGLRKIQY